jgi:hypothetical protein
MGNGARLKLQHILEVGVLTSEIKDGKNFISWTGLSGYSSDKDIVEFTRSVDVQQLPELSQKAICFLKAKNHAWKSVKVEFVVNPTPGTIRKVKRKRRQSKKISSCCW